MPIIIIITVVMFVVLIAWTWTNLGQIEKKQKIIYIIISIIITYIITLIIYNMSKIGIEYKNPNIEQDIQNLLTSLFTTINGFVIVQYIAKLIGKIHDTQIEKEDASKKAIIIAIIFIIVLIIECVYLKDIQNGILKVYEIKAS